MINKTMQTYEKTKDGMKFTIIVPNNIVDALKESSEISKDRYISALSATASLVQCTAFRLSTVMVLDELKKTIKEKDQVEEIAAAIATDTIELYEQSIKIFISQEMEAKNE
jgi:hypothetical protein